MISSETVDKIINSARIEEVVGDFVRLKKRGVNMLGLCPFHNEKTPSFNVSPIKGIYKCFGCGKSGDSINFVMEHEQMTFPEALRYIAGKYHIEVEETETPQEIIKDKTEKDSLYILMAAAQKYYAENMLNSDEGKAVGLTYLKERGLSTKTIETFQLGWSSVSRDAFTTWALKNGYLKEYLVRTGMTIETEDGRVFDRYHERVMFPITNVSGKIIGFGGRIIRSNAKEAKYINSPETEIYNKSKVLYGLSQARKSIRQLDSCIVVEGYMDVISMHQAGVENVVASSGTSLTEDQLRLVKRFTDNVIFFFDGDEAGRKATHRAMDMALEQELNPLAVVLPPEHDPDSFAREFDKEHIEEYLHSHGQNFVAFRSSMMSAEEKADPVKKAAVIKELIGSVILINDNLKRALFIAQIARALEVEEKLLYEELKRIYLAKVKQRENVEDIQVALPSQPESQPKERIESTALQEKHVLKLLLKFGSQPMPGQNPPAEKPLTIAGYMIAELEEEEWEVPVCEQLFNLVKNAHASGEPLPELAPLMNSEDPEIRTFATDMMVDREELSKNWEVRLGREMQTPDKNYVMDVRSAVSYFKLRSLVKLIRQNEKDIEKSQKEPAQLDHYLATHIYLSEQKKKIGEGVGNVIVH